MFGRPFRGVRSFLSTYLPLGDRLGEMFYAIWMVVISVGVLGATGLAEESVLSVIIFAFSVNITWGLIDGISVMYSNIIVRKNNEEIAHDIQIKGDAEAMKVGFDALDDGITTVLSESDRKAVLAMIASTEPWEDPSKKKYRPEREDCYYALGIFAIDVLLVIPLIIPLLVIREHVFALYVTRLIATAMFVIIGVAYANELNRRRWLVALWLGTLCFSLFSLAYLTGW